MVEKYIIRGREGTKIGVFETEWKVVVIDFFSESDEEAEERMKKERSLIDKELFKRIK